MESRDWSSDVCSSDLLRFPVTIRQSLANGVLGYTRSLDKLYQNGQSKTLTTYTFGAAADPFPVSVGNAMRSNTALTRYMGTVYIQAAVFYNVALSDAQHAELAEKMNAI